MYFIPLIYILKTSVLSWEEEITCKIRKLKKETLF